MIINIKKLTATSIVVLASFALCSPAQAVTYQTYVINSYGGESLLPIVRQQLNNSPDGGTVASYQDRLVLRTSATNYQTVQRLLSQIDSQPQAVIVAVRVGSTSNTQSDVNQGRVVISNRGIQGAGIINQTINQQQNNSLYQVQTLSGSAASISTNTLYSLTQNYQASLYSNNRRSPTQIIIQQQVLLPTTQGIAVTPRLLPDGQVEIKLTQVEERLRSSTRSVYNKGLYNQSAYNQRAYNQSDAIQGQRLDSTIIVPRGQWVTIGQIAQNTQNQSASFGGNRISVSNNNAPIQLLVK